MKEHFYLNYLKRKKIKYFRNRSVAESNNIISSLISYIIQTTNKTMNQIHNHNKNEYLQI